MVYRVDIITRLNNNIIMIDLKSYTIRVQHRTLHLDSVFQANNNTSTLKKLKLVTLITPDPLSDRYHRSPLDEGSLARGVKESRYHRTTLPGDFSRCDNVCVRHRLVKHWGLHYRLILLAWSVIPSWWKIVAGWIPVSTSTIKPIHGHPNHQLHAEQQGGAHDRRKITRKLRLNPLILLIL